FNNLAILEAKLAGVRSNGRPRLFAMGMRERPAPSDCPLYIRGEVEKPGAVVSRGTPQVLASRPLAIPANHSGRLEPAEWLTSREHPLTARVFVNRVWGHLFGRGLVATPDNFGASGIAPSDQPLLDELAVEFMEDGWSIKRLIRRLVLSHAYRLGTQH